MDLVRLDALARQRKISRRDFIRLAVSAGLTVAAADRLFVSTAHAATPKQGGKFRLGLAGANTTDFERSGNLGHERAHEHRSVGGVTTT